MRCDSPTHCCERQLAAGDVGELLVGEPRVALDAGHRLRQLFGGQAAAVAIGNRAAGRHEVHARQRLRAASDERDGHQPGGETRAANAWRRCGWRRNGHYVVTPLYTNASHLLSSCAASSGVGP